MPRKRAAIALVVLVLAAPLAWAVPWAVGTASADAVVGHAHASSEACDVKNPTMATGNTVCDASIPGGLAQYRLATSNPQVAIEWLFNSTVTARICIAFRRDPSYTTAGSATAYVFAAEGRGPGMMNYTGGAATGFPAWGGGRCMRSRSTNRRTPTLLLRTRRVTTSQRTGGWCRAV